MDQKEHIYTNFINKCSQKKLYVKQDMTVLNVFKLTLVLSNICEINFSYTGKSTIFENSTILSLPVT